MPFEIKEGGKNGICIHFYYLSHFLRSLLIVRTSNWKRCLYSILDSKEKCKQNNSEPNYNTSEVLSSDLTLNFSLSA